MSKTPPRLASDDMASIGGWSTMAAADIKLNSAINIKPSDLTKDQVIQLYCLMFPYISGEFVHRDTMMSWYNALVVDFTAKIQALNSQIETLTALLKNHSHPNNGSPSSDLTSISAPKLDIFNTVPENFKDGDSKIVESSAYSTAMPHRNPIVPSALSTPKVDFVSAFNSTLKLVPFDAEGSALITGDAEYVNLESLNNLGRL